MKKEKPIKKERKPLSKKTKGILFGVLSFVGSFTITALIILTFAVFIPQAQMDGQKKQYNEAVSLLNDGNYEEAANYFNNLSYNDSKNLYYVAKAGMSFDNGDYENGIQNIHDAGGSVGVFYDTNGGTASKNREVLKIKKKWVENTPIRNGYDFLEWKISSFSLSKDPKSYDAKLNLVASWNIVNYSVTYNLNGATLNGLVEEYNVDTPSFTLGTPVKKGYTFLGWSGTGIDGTSFDVTIGNGSTGNRSYEANFRANQYQITYVYGYDDLTDSTLITYDSRFSPPQVTREGYVFDGWYYEGTKVESGIWTIDSNATLIARWTVATYRLTFFNPNEERGKLTGSGTYTHGTTVSVIATANDGYTFLGWYNDTTLITEENIYTFVITADTHLTVRWSVGNTYTVTLEPDGGELSSTTMKVQYAEDYVLPVPTKTGYDFLGWFDESGTRLPDTGAWRFPSNKTLTARWSVSNYRIYYELNNGSIDTSYPSTYTYFEDTELVEPTRSGYIFDGWYLKDEKVDKIAAGNTGDITLEARWIPAKNNLVVFSEDTSKGTVYIESGTGYSEEQIIVVAIANPGYRFMGWEDGKSIVSNDAVYSFVMPPKDYTLIARFISSSAEDLGMIPEYSGDYVYYGLYPQTHVNDASLIAHLEEAPIDYINGWTKYNDEYYYKSKAEHAEGTFDDGTPFTTDSYYWFKCEKIKWQTIYWDGDGIAYTSTVLLDVGTFKGMPYTDSVPHANYAESRVRDWLNNDFLNAAFGLSSAYLHTVEVDNSPITTDANQGVVIPNTFDKVFLGSYADFIGLGSDTARSCYLTDYARTKMIAGWTIESDRTSIPAQSSVITRYYASYYTRSAYSEDESNYKLWCVDDFGRLETSYTYQIRGMRPCIHLNNPLLEIDPGPGEG